MSTPTDLIAERLSWELESWKTIEFRLHSEFRRDGDLSSQPQRRFDSYIIKARYVETSLGKRMYEEDLRTSDPGTSSVRVYYTDGKLAASRQKGVTAQQVDVKRYFGHEDSGDATRPYPLKAFFVGLQPLHKAIKRATPIGTDRCLGRDCETFLFRGERHVGAKRDLVYVLDTATSVPLKIKIYDTEALREADRPIVVWSALSFDEVHGHHFPSTSELVRTRVAKQSDSPYFRVKFVTDSVSFNQTYPSSMFWPDITDKTALFNHVTGRIAPPTTTKPAGPEMEIATTQVAPPIRADDGAGVSFGTVALWLGTALLAATIVASFWRRMSARSAEQ